MQPKFKPGDKVKFKGKGIFKNTYYTVKKVRYVPNFCDAHTDEVYDTFVVNFNTNTDIPEDVLELVEDARSYVSSTNLEPLLKAQIELSRGNSIN